MLKTSLTVALRTFRRRKGTTALHLAGLAVGLACCFLAALYVEDELAYDRFHAHADRTFRLAEERAFGGGETATLISSPAATAEALRTKVPAAELVVQVADDAGLVRRPGADEAFQVDNLLFADADFFRLFTFPLVRGDAARVLAAPGQAVLAASVARRLFGDADPVGETVLVERIGFSVQDPAPLALTVTGVAADAPATSTIRFGLVASGTTVVQGFGGPAQRLANGAATYVRTRTPAGRTDLIRAVGQLVESGGPGGFGKLAGVMADPLPSLHLAYQDRNATFAGQPRYLYLFSAVALFVLLVACINYTNLATAHAATRAKEVGVRKTVGAGRGALVRQFYAEALVLAGVAGLLALGLTSAALPAFNAFFGKGVAVDGPRDLALLVGMAALTLVVGLLAGSYPALYLSRLAPATMLRGGSARGPGGARLRQALVVVQFAITIGLMIATGVVLQQLRYSQRLDLGFRGDQVLTLNLSTPALARQRAALQSAVEAVPGVASVAVSSAVPGAFTMMIAVGPAGGNDPGQNSHVRFADTDAAFAETYGLRLAAGRYFADGEKTGVVVNEAAARKLGLMTTDAAEAVGKRFRVGSDVEVVGVVRDFHIASTREAIGPVVLAPIGEVSNRLTLSVRLDPRRLPETLGALGDVWDRLVPGYPFAYQFVDDEFAALYRNDRKLGQIFGVFAGLTVLLACLGLFGLAAHAAERRTKEVGVRKVLGASAASLVGLLSRDFLALVAVAFVLAVGPAYWAMSRWLEDFPYRVDLGPGVALAAGAVALVVAAVTVAGRALRAAQADPVRALRYE